MKYLPLLLFIILYVSCDSDRARLQGHWHMDSINKIIIHNGDTVYSFTEEEIAIGEYRTPHTRATVDIIGSKIVWNKNDLYNPVLHGKINYSQKLIEFNKNHLIENFRFEIDTNGLVNFHSLKDSEIWQGIPFSHQFCNRESNFFKNSQLKIDLLTNGDTITFDSLSNTQRLSTNIIAIGKRHSSRFSTHPSFREHIEINGHLATLQDIHLELERIETKVPKLSRDAIKNLILFNKTSPIALLPEIIEELKAYNPESIYLGFQKDTKPTEPYDIIMEKWDGSRVFPKDLSISFEEWIESES